MLIDCGTLGATTTGVKLAKVVEDDREGVRRDGHGGGVDEVGEGSAGGDPRDDRPTICRLPVGVSCWRNPSCLPALEDE
jgi:hypothetical protein